MAKYNLASPTAISAVCDLKNLEAWLKAEIKSNDAPLRRVVAEVCRDLPYFIRWAPKAILLWHGCDRIPLAGMKQRIHKYPGVIKVKARKIKHALDTRPNGPAIAAFLIAGGERPRRLGSNNSWSIHHLYSGKFPYHGRDATTHATKHLRHFTQSAGLIAVHPIADQMCDEIPAFSWFLRAESFRRFGYDPDGVFSQRQSKLGFIAGSSCKVICREEVILD